MERNQNPRPGDFLLSEANGTYSRENGILTNGDNLVAGTVLGRVLTATAAKVSGIGNGTLSAVSLGAHAEVGIYALTCIETSTNGGLFRVQTPSGDLLTDLQAPIAYVSSHINLTVGDGATDWAEGDVIHVTVTHDGYTILDPEGADGQQDASGVLWDNTNATDADTACVVIRRNAEVKADGLTWPAGITEVQKSNAIAQLAELGIVLR